MAGHVKPCGVQHERFPELTCARWPHSDNWHKAFTMSGSVHEWRGTPQWKPICKNPHCRLHYGSDVYGRAYHYWWNACCGAVIQGQKTGRVHKVYSKDGHYRIKATKRPFPIAW